MVAVVLVGAFGATACASARSSRPEARASSTTTSRPSTATTQAAPPGNQLLAVVADGLTAYESTPGGASTRVLDRTADGLGGRALTGQLCAVPAPDRRVAVGLAPLAPTDQPAWAIIVLAGDRLETLTADVVGQITGGATGATPTGCTALPDGRLVTADDAGRVAVWIPPLGPAARSCTLITGLVAPGQLAQDDQRRVYVTVGAGTDAGVFRIAAPAVTAVSAAGGCAGTDPAGGPQADRVRREPFLAASPEGVARPQGIAIDQLGPIYVAGPTPASIVETDANGTVVGRPAASGRPLGLAVDPTGSLYVADPGDGSTSGGRLLIHPRGDGALEPAEVIAAGIDRPLSVVVVVPAGGGGASKL